VAVGQKGDANHAGAARPLPAAERALYTQAAPPGAWP